MGKFKQLFYENEEGKFITIGASEEKKGRHIFIKKGENFDYKKLSKNWDKEKKKIVKDIKLTENEKDAILDYTKRGYKKINKILRSNNKYKDDKNIKNIIKNLDSAMEKSRLLKNNTFYENKSLYRAANIPEVTDAIEKNELKPGFIFRDKGFTSTSKSKEIANIHLNEPNEKMFVIHAKKNQKALDLAEYSAFGDREEEVLIARNTEYKVIEIENTKERIKKRGFGGKSIIKTIKVQYIHLEINNQD